MPHERDMTHWDEIGCQRGCDNHPTRTVQIHLGGPTAYRDLTPIPERFAMEFDIEVWDTDRTPVDGGPYCPARDAVSETIISHGVWEPRETTVLLLALECFDARCVFVDIGAQVGWFSAVAMKVGDKHAVAYEADATVAKVCHNNLRKIWSDFGGAGPTQKVYTQRITEATPPLDDEYIVHPDTILVVKIDIEGAEAEAVRVLEPEIDDERVPFILMEVSPVFNDSYPDLVTDLIARGYSAYLMPPKQTPPVAIDDLMDLVPYQLYGDLNEIAAQVESWHQEDVVFVHGGVEAWS